MLAILTIAVITVVIAIMVIQNERKKKVFRQDLSFCQQHIPSALHQIMLLSDITHNFNEAEEKQYTQDYKELYNTATRVVNSSFQKKENVDCNDIRDFLSKYKGVSSLRTLNNKLNDAYIQLTSGNLLEKALEDYAAIKRASSYLTESKKCEFVTKHSPIIAVIEFSLQHSELLNAIQANVTTATAQTLRDFCCDMKQIDKLKKEKNQEYVKRELAEKFFKQQNMIRVANEIIKIAGKGDIENYDKCVDILNKALIQGTNEDLGYCVFDNENETLSEDYRVAIPTGIGKIDETLEGGLGKGELGCIIGSSSFGKTSLTTAMASFAATYRCPQNNDDGYKVLQIVFEDRVKQIQRKQNIETLLIEMVIYLMIYFCI